VVKICEINDNEVILAISRLAKFTRDVCWKMDFMGGIIEAEYKLAIARSKIIEEDINLLASIDLELMWGEKKEKREDGTYITTGSGHNPWYGGQLTLEDFLKALEGLYDFWFTIVRNPGEEEFMHFYNFLTEKEREAPSIYDLFKSRSLHKSVISASEKLFFGRHYSQAIFEACKKLNKAVQRKSGSSADGKNLMQTVFSSQKPILKLNSMKNQSDVDEQCGFMEIFAGTMQGIRNPKGHEIINIKDPEKTLEYLSLISLLFRKLEKSHK